MDDTVTLRDLVLSYLVRNGSHGKPLSMRRFAAHVGVSVGTIRSILRGWYVPDDNTIRKLAVALHLHATEIYKILGKLGDDSAVTRGTLLQHRLLQLTPDELSQTEKFLDYLLYRRLFSPTNSD